MKDLIKNIKTWWSNRKLKRFLTAQLGEYAFIMNELQAGKKETHWMWYVFPQLKGLGKSKTAVFYAIKDLDEAKAYINHPVLGSRLMECTRIVLTHEDKTLHEIFGFPDDLKFGSCMELFSQVSDHSVFTKALEKIELEKSK
jgi:uncharacterized protein (DUF1810 family)